MYVIKYFYSIFKSECIKKFLKELKPDIIHVRSRVSSMACSFTNKNLNIKVVSTVHGFNSVGFYSSKIMQKSDAVICVIIV